MVTRWVCYVIGGLMAVVMAAMAICAAGLIAWGFWAWR